jgi:type IV pilus assembly protein PilB
MKIINDSLGNNLLSVAGTFGLPLLDLNAFDFKQIPIKITDGKLLRQHMVLPLLCKGKQLFVAVADPTNQIALDEIKFQTGLFVHCILVEKNKLRKLIERVITTQATITLDDLSDTALEELVTTPLTNNLSTEINKIDDAPIVRYIQKVLLDAVHSRVSDVHFEPYEKHYRIRTRRDGILYDIANPSSNLANRITARLKIMAQLDIAERRVPQDGRFKLPIAEMRSTDFRVSILPTVHGEKIVVRILDPSNTALTIETLGLDTQQEQLFCQAINKPHGMILVTGPTGSGKTVTLYTALSKLNTPAVNISTVEDPVEIHLHGLNQININLKTGLTFATVLRALLRQDPDIIMVGEMRDLETAEIGIQAAQTGHLVLSTLHTNSAVETLTRLVNMGVPAYNIATSVALIMAQRLVRCLCEQCKKIITVPDIELARAGFAQHDLADLKIYAPVGCEHCTHGYKGRLGIFELLPVTTTIGEIIMRGGSSLDIATQARIEGMCTLREAGLQKVKKGITSLAEINRMTKD